MFILKTNLLSSANIIKMFKKGIPFFILFVIILCSERITANNKVKVDVRVEGDIVEKTDFFGRRIYEGKIINNLNKRIDYVFIEFTLFNDKNEIIEKVKSYVSGITQTFKDSTISASSIEQGETANFKCFTSMMAESIIKYKYDIKWKVFHKLPDKY